MDLIDIHNHMLPGVDDGAPDVDTALAMARLAVDGGIVEVVCTPHIHPGRFENNKGALQRHFEEFAQRVAGEGIPLKLHLAAEMRFDATIIQQVLSGEVPFLGQWQGRQVLLLEFPHDQLPFAAEKLTGWLLEHDIVPMIAHPERNRGFIREPALLKPFAAQGCLMQGTGGSFMGRFGESARVLAEQMLAAGYFAFVASDAHNLDFRSPALSAPLERVTELAGSETANRLFRENPRLLVGDG